MDDRLFRAPRNAIGPPVGTGGNKHYDGRQPVLAILEWDTHNEVVPEKTGLTPAQHQQLPVTTSRVQSGSMIG
ncbi:MAG: hypothetical protein QM628_15510 [Propionicimonas sp.]